MTEPQGSAATSADLSLLYELSLSVGTSLDLVRCCDAFLTTLMARKELTLASVWIANEHLASRSAEPGFSVVYCRPQSRVRERSIPAQHPLALALQDSDHVTVDSEDARFPLLVTEFGVRDGCFGLMRLGELGFLKLHSTACDLAFAKVELTPLRQVVAKFAVALEGCLSHERMKWETHRRERIERAHRDSEERYRTLYEDNPSMYFTLDPEGTVVSVNGFGASQLGYTPGELIGQPVLDVFHEDDRAAVSSQLQEALANPGEVFRWSFRKVRKDGVVIWVEEFARAIRGRVLIVCQDITDQKVAEEERQKLQAQIQAAQKLESLGVLAGGVAHDFNNLLVGILGNAELARLDLPPGSPLQYNLLGIERSAQHAAELCKQLLAYSGQGQFVIEPVSLNDIIHDMVGLVRSATKQIDLELDLDPNAPVIDADAAQIGQIILNLVTNAAEAIGDESGVIRVSTGTTSGDEAWSAADYLGEVPDPGPWVYAEIADDGCGMDEETRRRIFDPFFTTKFTGRGLGLAAVLGIVRGHGGAIGIESDPGAGTTFRILLRPSTERARRTDREWEPEHPWPAQGTILVVDDEDSVRTVSSGMLERLGYRVVTASGGHEAVELFRQRPSEYSLVLLDMTMPQLNGQETFRQLRAIRDDVRVILCSGYNEQRASSRFEEAGPVGFLQKPFKLQEVARSVSAALGE